MKLKSEHIIHGVVIVFILRGSEKGNSRGYIQKVINTQFIKKLSQVFTTGLISTDTFNFVLGNGEAIIEHIKI